MGNRENKGTGNNGKKRLTDQEIKRFQKLLLAKRAELLGDMSFMENETLRKDRTDLSSVPFHMADLGSDNYEQEFNLGLVDSERKVLREIDAALERIEEGTYGICEGKGEQIGRPRLRAIPWARYCVKCAGLLEKGLLKRDEEYSYNYSPDNEEAQRYYYNDDDSDES